MAPSKLLYIPDYCRFNTNKFDNRKRINGSVKIHCAVTMQRAAVKPALTRSVTRKR